MLEQALSSSLSLLIAGDALLQFLAPGDQNAQSMKPEPQPQVLVSTDWPD